MEHEDDDDDAAKRKSIVSAFTTNSHPTGRKERKRGERASEWAAVAGQESIHTHTNPPDDGILNVYIALTSNQTMA